MVTPFADAWGNLLVNSLPPGERARVLGACTEVQMDFGVTLQVPNARIRYVYFPLDGYISLITPRGEVQSLEVGLVGREGVMGATLLLGVAESPLQGLVQGTGTALRMSASAFGATLKKCPRFRQRLHAYLFVLMSQLAQTAACGRFHPLQARLARWVLMTHDRAAADVFPLTHQFLAQMLGVRRAGVTEAAGSIQAKKVIYYRRGTMQVLNRRALESLTCGCYATFNKTYERHVGGSRKSFKPDKAAKND